MGITHLTAGTSNYTLLCVNRLQMSGSTMSKAIVDVMNLLLALSPRWLSVIRVKEETKNLGKPIILLWRRMIEHGTPARVNNDRNIYISYVFVYHIESTS